MNTRVPALFVTNPTGASPWVPLNGVLSEYAVPHVSHLSLMPGAVAQGNVCPIGPGGVTGGVTGGDAGVGRSRHRFRYADMPGAHMLANGDRKCPALFARCC
jgi:hypothetical protein